MNDQNAHEADDVAQAEAQPTPQASAIQTAAAVADAPVAARVAELVPEPEPLPVTEPAPDMALDSTVRGLAQPDDVSAEAPPAEAAPEPPTEVPTEVLAVFVDTGLSEPILKAVAEKGYVHPTPIQAQAIPVVLAGRDIMGVAQTGTGKTASFVLPMMDILHGSRARARMPRSLILEPTRELALQVAENFVLYGKYLKLNHALLIGGESMSEQKDALTKGVDVLIATPGRLLDLIERGGLLLTDCKILVIDEADRMLDMGFIPDVEKIVNFLPANRQTLFFSATMAPEIRRLADAFLQNPKTITVSKSATVATTIVAGLALVAEHDKREALRRLIRSEDVQSALIFCNRKTEVDILYKSLTRHGFSVGALHGDMPQPARFATLEKFKASAIRLLVCSDVAARGIDIGGLSHVFNFDVPHHSEDYVHRIGRTGRAGREGHAYTLASPDDRLAVEAIEKLTAGAIPRIVVPGLDVVEWSEGDSRKRRGRGGSSRGPKRGGADDKARADKPREARKPDDKPARERTGEAPRRQPRPEPKPEIRAEARPESRAEPWVAVPDTRPDRAPRERRWRDEDLGPSVTGFGDDVPAFMMLPRRAARARAPEHEEVV